MSSMFAQGGKQLCRRGDAQSKLRSRLFSSRAVAVVAATASASIGLCSIASPCFQAILTRLPGFGHISDLQKVHSRRQFALSLNSRHSSRISRKANFGKTFIAEAPSQHDATVIWLHGLGDTGEGWSDVAPQLQQLLPSVRFLFPTASAEPVTVNMGMRMPSWFDINSLEPELFALNPAGMSESVAYVRQLVQDELNSGVRPGRVILAGFSQGGAVVLDAALGFGSSADSPIGGVLVLSSFVGTKLPEKLSESALEVHMFHGEADPVVPLKWGQRSFDTLKDAGISATFNTYPGLQHSACFEELSDIAKVLVKLLTLDLTD
eukprot:TRINITY_DN2174_c2_g3_i2.p1 TRINITY_DN2174_c2_g3~~TRINITY_DN2174_c2_g3_i2.p1  ORF type:complete len:321 (-),score=67.00 TRINITY_DN2174_c2_g3_i2:288-1250(-)